MSLNLEITGLILAGGAGQRMGGQDKGVQPFRGKPLVHWVSDRLTPQVGALLISANRHLDEYAALGWPVVSDAPEHAAQGYCGPLAGLYAGLRAARTELLLCVPCDTPFLPADLAARLLHALGDAQMAVARCNGHRQPAVCLLRRTPANQLTKQLADFLATGERKLGLWQQQAGAIYVDFPDPAAFANVNTPDELHALEACYTHPP